MRRLAVAALLLAAAPALAQDDSEQGQADEVRVEGDLNGDGIADLAVITGDDDQRTLTVRLSYKSEVEIGVEPDETLVLEPASVGGLGELAIERGVLKFDDLTGGTTAIASTRRYRYDAAGKHMRLIGLDATLYSRTYAHDGYELSWNLLTGDLITRELHLNEKGGDAAYDPIVEHKGTRRSGKVWLTDTPDPETLIDELSGA